MVSHAGLCWRKILLASLVLLIARVHGVAGADDNFFPLKPGMVMQFRETRNILTYSGSKTNVITGNGTVRQRILDAPPRFADKPGVTFSRSVLKEQRDIEGKISELTGGSDDVWQWRDGVLYLLGARSWVEDGYTEPMNYYSTPLVYLRPGLKPGDTWTVGTQAVMGLTLLTSAKVEGTDTVTVPAGTFTDCVRVNYQSDKVTGTLMFDQTPATIQEGTYENIVWYAKDVGIVKEIQRLKFVFPTSAGALTTQEEQTRDLETRKTSQ